MRSIADELLVYEIRCHLLYRFIVTANVLLQVDILPYLSRNSWSLIQGLYKLKIYGMVIYGRYVVQLVNLAARYLSGPLLHSSGFAVSNVPIVILYRMHNGCIAC